MAPLKIHRWGSPRPSAWLCLHGFMGTGFDWDVFARAALKLAARGYVLEAGRITLSGSGQDLASDNRVREAYLGEG